MIQRKRRRRGCRMLIETRSSDLLIKPGLGQGPLSHACSDLQLLKSSNIESPTEAIPIAFEALARGNTEPSLV